MIRNILAAAVAALTLSACAGYEPGLAPDDAQADAVILAILDARGVATACEYVAANPLSDPDATAIRDALLAERGIVCPEA